MRYRAGTRTSGPSKRGGFDLRGRLRALVKTRGFKIALIVLGISAGLFVLANLVLLAVFWGRTYPNAMVAGQELGSVKYADVDEQLGKMKLLPSKVAVGYRGASVSFTPAQLGLELDSAGLTEAVHERSWLPAWNLVRATDTPLTLEVDDKTLEKELVAIGEKNKTAPVDGKIVQQAGAFVLVKQKNGSEMDLAASKTAVVTGVRKGHAQVAVVVKDIEPVHTDKKLSSGLEKLQRAQRADVQYTAVPDKKYSAKESDIVSWYHETTPGTSEFDISDPVLKAFILNLGKSWGLRVTNTSQTIAATRAALDAGEPVSFVLEGTPYVAASKTYKYCTALRDVGAEHLPVLKSKLASTYADDRGWGLGGLIEFTHASANCDFTVWLSAAAQVPSFGGVCDSTWSCRVGPNVVINFDRWQGTSPAWVASGGSVEDYRSMVINHETGHWFEFGHKFCPAAGQKAPVMQQQSIDLAGCTFNPWPLDTEKAQLKANLGI